MDIGEVLILRTEVCVFNSLAATPAILILFVQYLRR